MDMILMSKPRKSKEEIPKEVKEKIKPTCEMLPHDYSSVLRVANAKKLTDIAGIGDVTAQNLNDKMNIYTVDDLATAREDELAQTMKVTSLKAKQWVSDARDSALHDMNYRKLQQEADYQEGMVLRFITGSLGLNNILGGGVETGAITACAGRSETGKTCIGTDIAIDAIYNHYSCKKCFKKLSKDETCVCGEKARPVEVVYIETEPNTIKYRRLQQIAESKGYKNINWDLFHWIPAEKVTSCKRQEMWYDVVSRKIEDENCNIRLVIVDSFNKWFGAWTRRELLPIRAKEYEVHFTKIQLMTTKFKLAWYLTFQVIGAPDPSQTLGLKARFGGDYMPAGGEKPLHTINQGIMLNQKSKVVHEAYLFASSYLPPQAITFSICESGLKDDYIK